MIGQRKKQNKYLKRLKGHTVTTYQSSQSLLTHICLNGPGLSHFDKDYSEDHPFNTKFLVHWEDLGGSGGEGGGRGDPDGEYMYIQG